jgi:CDP-glycerol glycerophosphotransferase
MINIYHAKPESLLYSGRPREDALFIEQKNRISDLKKSIGIEDKKIILYAPTFRETDSFSKSSNFHLFIDFKEFEREIGPEYVVLYHGHHFTVPDGKIPFSDFFIDLSTFDLNDLYLMSDILVTDYSSAMFDFGLLHKPMICFAPDYFEYNKKRPLLFDLKAEFPGGICFTQQDLVKRIINLSNNPETKEFDLFVSKFVSRGTNASGAVVDRICEIIKGRNKKTKE